MLFNVVSIRNILSYLYIYGIDVTLCAGLYEIQIKGGDSWPAKSVCQWKIAWDHDESIPQQKTMPLARPFWEWLNDPFKG